MNGAATAIESSPKNTSSPPEKSGPRQRAAMAWKRSTAVSAVASSAAESNALTGVGAWLWASGSQVCIGASPALVP